MGAKRAFSINSAGKTGQLYIKNEIRTPPNTTNKEKKGAGRKTFLTSDYITKLQSSKQYGMAQKQKYRPTKQDREPRNKPMHLWVPYL